MTPEQEKAFRERGCIYIPGALEKNVVQPVRDHVLKELKRLNIWSTGRVLSQKLKGVPVFQQAGKLGQLISYPGLNEKLVSQELYSVSAYWLAHHYKPRLANCSFRYHIKLPGPLRD